MGERILKVLVAVALLGGLAVVSGGLAGATTTCSTSTGHSSCIEAATAKITAGTLTVEAPATVAWADTLNGVNQAVDAPLAVSVIDATGSGAGWSAEMAMTTLTDSSTSKKLPTTAVRLNGSSSTATAVSSPATSCGTNSTCTLPTSTPAVTYPFTVPAGTTAPTAGVISTAKATTGMGTIKLPFDAWLHVPANAYAGTYVSTITVTMVSGP